MQRQPMSTAAANAVYDVLVASVGASEGDRGSFVHTQTREWCSEYRFQGALGFGGKFWRNTGRRADGSFGETWYVNGYPEDSTPELKEIIADTTKALEDLRVQRTDS